MNNNYNSVSSYKPMPTWESTYTNHILKRNKGKKIDAFMTFPHSNEWRDQTFKGIIENADTEHLIMSDPSNGNWYLLPMEYINFIKFEEQVNINEAF